MKVLIYPESENPHLELIYSEIRSSHTNDTFSYLQARPLNIIFLPLLLVAKRLIGYRVIHLHWPLFYINPNHGIPFSRCISFIYSILCLASIKLLGYKLIWTVHNVLPHERNTIDDRKVASFLAAIASAKIVHSADTIKKMKQKKLNVKNTYMIPMASFHNVYPDNISDASARKKLGISKNEFVLLFFGAIRPYKGVDDLLDVLTTISAPRVTLIIAGKGASEELKENIKKAEKKIKIHFYDGFIENEDVATYFRASDAVCLPFKAITTSGSVMLGMSFSRPVIAPRIGNVADLPINTGYLYDPSKSNVLHETIKFAIHDKKNLKRLGANAYAYVSALAWDKIAEQTYKLYQEVLKEPTKDRS